MQTRSSKTTIVAAELVLIVTLGFSLFFSGSYSRPALANENAGPNTKELRAGKNFIPTKVYSAQDDEQILKFFEGLRVSDVSDVGSIGSNNIMGWMVRGCVGVVTNATARDTDEIITEKVPLYFKRPGRGIRPGRNEIESINRPIVCGGVLVEPGDVIVADGDGVIVVPRAHAKEVAKYAKTILDGDKAGRRNLYKKLGLPPDDSVK